MRQIILYPGEDGFWVVECPSLPGCVSQGEDKPKPFSTFAKPSRVTSRCWKKTVFRYLKNDLRPL